MNQYKTARKNHFRVSGNRKTKPFRVCNFYCSRKKNLSVNLKNSRESRLLIDHKYKIYKDWKKNPKNAFKKNNSGHNFKYNCHQPIKYKSKNKNLRQTLNSSKTIENQKSSVLNRSEIPLTEICSECNLCRCKKNNIPRDRYDENEFSLHIKNYESSSSSTTHHEKVLNILESISRSISSKKQNLRKPKIKCSNSDKKFLRKSNDCATIFNKNNYKKPNIKSQTQSQFFYPTISNCGLRKFEHPCFTERSNRYNKEYTKRIYCRGSSKKMSDLGVRFCLTTRHHSTGDCCKFHSGDEMNSSNTESESSSDSLMSSGRNSFSVPNISKILEADKQKREFTRNLIYKDDSEGTTETSASEDNYYKRKTFPFRQRECKIEYSRPSKRKEFHQIINSSSSSSSLSTSTEASCRCPRANRGEPKSSTRGVS